MILLIETATKICSVGLCKDEQLLANKNAEGNFKHSSELTLLIEGVMKLAKKEMSDLKAVAVSIGPGSYTGLRIGLSTAKGICYALGLPLITIDTLKSLALSAMKEAKADYYAPMIDARRMEVYTLLYNNDETIQMPKQAMIVDENSFSDWLNAGKTIAFCGDGAPKCQAVITSKNAQFLSLECDATNLVTLANRAYKMADFADLAYSEPLYFKPPNITKPKKIL